MHVQNGPTPVPGTPGLIFLIQFGYVQNDKLFNGGKSSCMFQHRI